VSAFTKVYFFNFHRFFATGLRFASSVKSGIAAKGSALFLKSSLSDFP
jgi:hypothetical protein